MYIHDNHAYVTLTGYFTIVCQTSADTQPVLNCYNFLLHKESVIVERMLSLCLHNDSCSAKCTAQRHLHCAGIASTSSCLQIQPLYAYNTQTEHFVCHTLSSKFRPVLLYSTVIRFETVAMSLAMRANYSIHGRLTGTVQLVSCDRSTWKPTVM